MGEAANHIEGIVGMHRAEYQMPGERSLHRNLCRFGVANLTHHHPVGVVTKDGAQATREGETLFFVNRNLHHPLQLILHRIFDGDDLVAPGIRFRYRGIERGGLAAAGGAGHQQHAVRQRRQPTHRRARWPIKSERLQGERALGLVDLRPVQHPDHRILAKHARHDGQTKVDVAALHPQLEATILRQSPLTDIQLGHHLQARDQLLGNGDIGNALQGQHHAIDTIADVHANGGALHMDIAGALLQAIEQQRIQHADHRIAFLGQPLCREFMQRRLRSILEQAGLQPGHGTVLLCPGSQQCIQFARRTRLPANAGLQVTFQTLQQQPVALAIGQRQPGIAGSVAGRLRRGTRIARQHHTPALRLHKIPAAVVRHRLQRRRLAQGRIHCVCSAS